MNINPELIKIEDWVEFGGGFTAASFYHRTDDTVMMKLYAPFIRPEEPLYELEFSEKVAKLGIPVAKPLKYVQSDDGRFGGVFERLPNKRSISRILADEPERLDEMAKLFADETKKLHKTECDTGLFKSVEERIIADIKDADFLPDTLKANVMKVLENTPKCTTCLHGDLHTGNLVLTNGRPIMIDLGDFSYGNPLYDLGLLYFQAAYNTEEMCMELYHISLDIMKKFWEKFAEYYFDNTDNLDEILKPYVMLTAVKYSTKMRQLNDDLKIAVRDYL